MSNVLKVGDQFKCPTCNARATVQNGEVGQPARLLCSNGHRKFVGFATERWGGGSPPER